MRLVAPVPCRLCRAAVPLPCPCACPSVPPVPVPISISRACPDSLCRSAVPSTRTAHRANRLTGNAAHRLTGSARSRLAAPVPIPCAVPLGCPCACPSVRLGCASPVPRSERLTGSQARRVALCRLSVRAVSAVRAPVPISKRTGSQANGSTRTAHRANRLGNRLGCAVSRACAVPPVRAAVP